MLLNAITRKSALSALLLLVVILISTTVRYALSPFELEIANSPYSERTISLIFAAFVMFVTGFIEGKTLIRSGLNKGYCALPIPIYGILACGIAFAPNALTTACTSFCFALATFLILRSLHQAEEKDPLFFASILLGIMVILFPPSIILVTIIPLSFLILALSIRQVIIMIAGYLIPLFTASYIVWYKGGEFWDLAQNIFAYLSIQQMDRLTQPPYLAIAMVVIIVAILIWEGIYSAIRPDKMFLLARVRRSLSFFAWLFVLTLSMLFIPACDLSILAIMAVPTTILLSFMLSLLPNNQSTIAYWVLLLLFAIHLFVA